jgi:ribonuclease P protein component
VAYAIPKQVGGAVVRNRVRRRLRAAVDQVASVMAPGDYLVGADAIAASTAFDELIHSLRTSLRAAGALREDHT